MTEVQQGFAPKYRADIDGLRAVAVLAVLGFHLFDGALPGGYLGVDVFFVLSGFLITTILARECEAGTYSILRFYDRRIRRIMPALLFVIAVTSAFAFLLYLPTDLMGYGESVLATFAFVSNIYFWRDTNYFSADALTKPLLHTWSLGIEEQFYIVFPILLLVLMRLGRLKLTLAIVIALTVASFIAAGVTLHMNKAIVAFYLLPMRAWELGVGAMLALVRREPPRSAGSANLLALMGAAMVVGSLVLLRPNAINPVPVAIFTTIGTALLIWTGVRGTWVARALATRPMVAIGLISYSLYLWHWPLYVLARYWLIRPPSAVESALLMALAIALAALSWRFVERPFRGHAMPFRRVAWYVGPATVALAALAVVAILTQGLPGRFNAQSAVYNARAGTHYRCDVKDYLPFGPFYACPVNLPDRTPAHADVILFGNSHALMYQPALAPELARRNLNGLLVTGNGCVPVRAFNTSPSCLSITRGNLDAVARHPRARLVIIAFAWNGIDAPMIDAEGRPIGTVSIPRLLEAMDSTIGELKAAGKDVVVVGPIPYPGYNLASTISREIAFRGAPRSPLSQSRQAFDARSRAIEAWLAGSPGGATPLFPSRLFCSRQACSYLLDGVPAYSDANHLSRLAMPAFRPMFGRAVDASLGASPVPRSGGDTVTPPSR